MTQDTERAYLARLRQNLETRYSEGELRTLCFDLGVDYDSLPGEGKADRARELVAYAVRHNTLADLVQLGRASRPDIQWSSDTAGSGESTGTQTTWHNLLRSAEPMWVRARLVVVGALAVILTVSIGYAIRSAGLRAKETPTPTTTPTQSREPIALSSPTPTPTGAVPTPGPSGMTYVEGGTFWMGDDGSYADAKPGEGPAHPVSLDAFWIDIHEVTNAEYRQCVETGPCSAPQNCLWGKPSYSDGSKAEHPVVCVDWNDARRYCQWVGSRLPTEAEWEYAARGTDRRIYPWGNTFDAAGLNYCDQSCENAWRDTGHSDGFERTAPVGRYPRGESWCGALDMAGNVLEWTSTLYRDYPYKADDGRESVTGEGGRVLRGGSWSDAPSAVYAVTRSSEVRSYKSWHVGFRCASDAE